MKTVFYGGSSYVIPVLEVLKQFDLTHVFTTEKAQDEPVIAFCKNNNIPYSSVSGKNDLKTTDADLAVVADFGLIIPNELINSFPKGVLNVHPSLLPKFRGPTPVQSAILEGETKTGVTIIKIDESVDHGPILIQKEYEISVTDTSDDLLKKLFAHGASLLNEVLKDYVNGKLQPKEQDHANATFTKIFVKDDGFIDIAAFPEHKKLENMIRAFYPWPGVWTKTQVNGQEEKIVKFLPGKKVQVEGKKPMSYKDFLNGYPNANTHLKLFIEQNV